jgi:hypothetical protein
MADRISWSTKWLKRAELLFVVLTAGGMLAVLITDRRQYEIITAVLAALSLLVTLYQFRFNPEEVGRAHRSCAKRLWRIREEYCLLIGDLISGAVGVPEIRVARDQLLDKLSSVYESAPESDAIAYRAAQKALKIDEELSFSEREIDELLPLPLRSGRQKP